MEIVVMWKCDQCSYMLIEGILIGLPEGWWEHDDLPNKHFHSLGCAKKYVLSHKGKEGEK
jgi:hypothetical protein